MGEHFKLSDVFARYLEIMGEKNPELVAGITVKDMIYVNVYYGGIIKPYMVEKYTNEVTNLIETDNRVLNLKSLADELYDEAIIKGAKYVEIDKREDGNEYIIKTYKTRERNIDSIFFTFDEDFKTLINHCAKYKSTKLEPNDDVIKEYAEAMESLKRAHEKIQDLQNKYNL